MVRLMASIMEETALQVVTKTSKMYKVKFLGSNRNYQEAFVCTSKTCLVRATEH